MTSVDSGVGVGVIAVGGPVTLSVTNTIRGVFVAPGALMVIPPRYVPASNPEASTDTRTATLARGLFDDADRGENDSQLASDDTVNGMSTSRTVFHTVNVCAAGASPTRAAVNVRKFVDKPTSGRTSSGVGVGVGVAVGKTSPPDGGGIGVGGIGVGVGRGGGAYTHAPVLPPVPELKAPVTTTLPPMETASPRAPCAVSVGSWRDGVSDVVAVVHPPRGLENRYTVPESLPLVCPLSLADSPMAILLPSAFADTDDPKLYPAAPSAAVNLADAAVAAHPPDGLVNTYAAPLRSALA